MEHVARRSSLQQRPSMREVSSKLYHGPRLRVPDRARRGRVGRFPPSAVSVPGRFANCGGKPYRAATPFAARRDLFPHGGAERRICTFEVVRRRIYENIVRATCTSVTVMLSVGMSADQAEPHHVTLCSIASHPFSGAL